MFPPIGVTNNNNNTFSHSSLKCNKFFEIIKIRLSLRRRQYKILMNEQFSEHIEKKSSGNRNLPVLRVTHES